MKEKTKKDFGTSAEYLAYLNGFNDGILWCKEASDKVCKEVNNKVWGKTGVRK